MQVKMTVMRRRLSKISERNYSIVTAGKPDNSENN